MATLSPNLSISPSQRRWACVLDPSLFLSHYGLSLVQALGEVLELWIARELWHILDNPSFYLSQPEWDTFRPAWERSSEWQTTVPQKRLQAFRYWELRRVQTPPADLNLFWIGDRPADSFLPDGCDPQLIEHWEAIAQSLDQRLQQQYRDSHIIALAFRDTAALAAVLGSAFILSYQASGTSEKANAPPEICQVLELWGIPCQEISSLNAIAVMEREKLLQLMISTGLSKFLWSGLSLIVLHLFVPSALTTGCKTQLSGVTPSCNQGEIPEAGLFDCWEEAKGFWYRL